MGRDALTPPPEGGNIGECGIRWAMLVLPAKVVIDSALAFSSGEFGGPDRMGGAAWIVGNLDG